MGDSFLSLLKRYAGEYYGDLREVQPDVEEKGVQNDTEFQEEEDLRKGAILKGIIAEGSGPQPASGDLVYVHLRLGRDDTFRWSTREEDGGQGHPQPFILGKSAQLLKGLELAVTGMRQGERALLEIKPAYAFMHKDWKADVPPGLRREDTVKADVELIKVVPGRQARLIHDAEDTYRITVRHADEWEMPRKPYKVKVRVQPCGMEALMDLPAPGNRDMVEMAVPALEATLGSGELPPALDTALRGLTRGEQCVLDCPVNDARGGSAVASPPASASGRAQFLVCLDDFTQVRDLTGDGEVIKETLTKGTGMFPVECPVEDSLIRAHYRVRRHGAGGAVLYDTRTDESLAGEPVEFYTGMDAVPDVVDLGTRLMLVGETALVTSTWKYSYKARAQVPEGAEQGETLDFEIELLGFTRDQIADDTSTAERLEITRKWKDQGNQLYKTGNLKLAKAKYFKAAKTIDRITSFDDESSFQSSKDIQVSCYLNLALCAQKNRESAEATHYSDKALEVDPKSVKAYFRRAAAATLVGDYDSARQDLAAAVEIDPSFEPDAKRELARYAGEERAQAQKQKASFGSFFK